MPTPTKVLAVGSPTMAMAKTQAVSTAMTCLMTMSPTTTCQVVTCQTTTDLRATLGTTLLMTATLRATGAARRLTQRKVPASDVTYARGGMSA